MASNDLARKSAVYLGNFIVRPVGNLIKAGSNLGNPYGALAYGFLDIFRNVTPKIKENKYIRFAEAGGFIGYTGKVILDLLPMIKGNFEHLIDLPFDVSMAVELGINVKKDYVGKNVKSDLKEIPNDLEKAYYFLFGEPIDESNKNPSKEDISKSNPFWKRKIINIKPQKNNLESKAVVE